MQFLALFWVALLVLFAWRIAAGKTKDDTIDRGRELLMAGMPERALKVFERLARQRSKNAPGRERSIYWLARTYEELGDAERARAIYKRYLNEYVYSPNVRADHEVQNLVRQRLGRLGVVVAEAPAPDGHQQVPSAWERFKAERDAVLVKVREKEPPPHVVARLITPPEAEPVSPEKIAKDLHAISAGRRIGDYVLAEKLGEGGFGEVYRALRPVAIKLARDPAVIEHLRRFGTIQGQVHSDRVVKPLEVNLKADPPYVVMELVDGCTLRDLLETREIKDGEALTVMREVALGLRDAHEAGVLHLDLKPENVLLDESGKVKLTDFELGNMTEESAQFRLSRSLGTSEQDAKIAGTIAYMSPEQRDGKVPDARSDIYTFGVMLFEALTGEHPQPGDKISDLRKDLAHGAEIDRIFERCFTRHERRYASTRELAKDLEWVCERLPKADLAALMHAAPKARERVEKRATLPQRSVTSSEERRAAEEPPRSEEKVTASPTASSSEVRVKAKEPIDPAPTAREEAALDALVAARAAAARARAEAPVAEKPVRPPIPVSAEKVEATPPPLPVAVRPPIPLAAEKPVEQTAPPENGAQREEKKQLEAS
ncbi:MAG TPA: protein kinase [Planctomycetota bacterium]|nr:protein kinase [Planctomycetota bacterium]